MQKNQASHTIHIRIMKKNTLKTLASLAFMLSLSLVFAKQALAQPAIFGTINAPAGVSEYNDQSGSDIGIILFASNVLKATTVIAGIWVMINFILAGWTYITSNGDSGAHAKVSSQLTMSVIGLLLIVGAYTIAALLGLIIFGDAGYILNPTFEGVGVSTTPPVFTGPGGI